MLTASMQVKLGDFGVARSHDNRQEPHSPLGGRWGGPARRRWSIDISRDQTAKCGTGKAIQEERRSGGAEVGFHSLRRKQHPAL